MGLKEKIMVYGDYDVDGTTAVARLQVPAKFTYSNIEYYIPTPMTRIWHIVSYY